ncbi:hypothetical protein LMJF_21_0870 [Leishmania major strain Friedlin]|uniref:Uncharacterized protein n=1 Tax=Leishmania major TaxID=5664 RepID=Q4QCB7_LEIMA|nr:hypothetical protein LMJF_21_0870 [Leishmania major strain Friedlin]CAG9573425.1 hypothetical_protein_-_conserved [Leishmania major strain Friedlin]CAJ04361.1 hypothetical protein LMJF_21_0870 [Leishmania major strain Friedlin]|eukprot:XP_001683031.1 hypothetical protein LMJF_21_0870 [Leishmania major strain Friedlin]
MRDGDCGEAQSLPPPVVEDASAAVIADAVDTSRHDLSCSPSAATENSTLAFSPPTQEPTPLPTPAARLFASRPTPSASPLIAGTRPSRWPSTSPLRSCGSPIVTFAPSTRFDQCRQRTNVAVRRSDDVPHFALPIPLLELPLSSTWASSGQMTDSALRAIGLQQPRVLAGSPPTPSPRQTPSSTQSEGLRDFAVDDFSDTASSADSACSTNSSSTMLLDSDIPAVRPRTPPSLALGLSIPSVVLLVPPDCKYSAIPSVMDEIDSSAVAAVDAATKTTPPSLANTRDVSFALLEPEKLARTTARFLTETVVSIREQCHVASAETARMSVALAQCRKTAPAACLMDTSRLTSMKVPPPPPPPPPPLLESLSLSSTPEVTPSIPPLLLAPSPPNSVELANSKMVLRVPDTPSKRLHAAPLDPVCPGNNVELLVNAAAEVTTLWQHKSSPTAIVLSRWGGEEIDESPHPTGSPADKAAAAIFTATIAEVSCDSNLGTGAIDAQPSKATTPPHTSCVAAPSSGGSDASDRCEGTVENFCTSFAGTEQVGEDGAAVTTHPTPHPPPLPAEIRFPHDQERCAVDSAAAAGTARLRSPSKAHTPSRPRLFQHPLKCSPGVATRSLAMAFGAGRSPPSSAESHVEKDGGTHERLSQPPLRINAAREALQSSCEGPAAISVAMTSGIARAAFQHLGCAVVEQDDSADATSPAKQPIHSGSSSSRSCDVGAGTPCLVKAPKDAAAASSPLPLASPTPPRSVLATGYLSLFRLSGDQGSSHLPRCPQRQLPMQPITPFAKDITSATTSRPHQSSSSPVRQPTGGLDVSLLSLTMESGSAPRRSTNLSLSGTPLQHAFPMLCGSPHALTATIATARQYSGSEGSRSPTSTARSGPRLLSPFPPLSRNAPYGGSAPISPKGAGTTDE